MTQCVISAPSDIAARAGAAVAQRGGTAVDAAVTATIVGMVTEPGIVGPGAGCFIVVGAPGSAAEVIDGYVAMPGVGGRRRAGSPMGRVIEMAYGGGMTTAVGPASVAVPGAWDAFAVATERYGAMAWRDLVTPAREAVAAGFPLSGASARYLEHAYLPIFRDADQGILGGEAPLEGTIIRGGELETGLGLIADEGPRTWYDGTVAVSLLEGLGESTAITAEDLSAYRAITRSPVSVALGGWSVSTNSTNSIGGPVLGALLLTLQALGFDEWSTEGIATMVEAQRRVLGHRRSHLDGAADLDAAARRLLDAARSTRGLDAPSTIHVSAVDGEGLACAITTSAGYGSGVVVPGTGLALNNSLGEIDLYPDGLDSIRPGERLPSNMAPSVARHEDGGVMALGSPGAARITTALATVLAAMALMGDDAETAITRPRLHVDVASDPLVIAHEEPLDIPAPFAARTFPPASMYFGGVGLAQRLGDGSLHGVTDPRRTGAVATAP